MEFSMKKLTNKMIFFPIINFFYLNNKSNLKL